MLDIYTCISEFLDYKGIAKLMQVSKAAHDLLIPKFITDSRPHALAHIAQQILAHRMRTPADPFAFHSRSGNMLHFIQNIPAEIHMMTLFDTEVKHGTTTVEVSAVYTHITTGRCRLLGSITATLTPSIPHPMRSGSVTIYNDNRENIAVFDYTDHLLAIEWCPLQRPGF